MATRDAWPNHVQFRTPAPEPDGRDPRVGMARCYSPRVLPASGCCCGFIGSGEPPCPDWKGRPLCAD